MRTKSRVPLDLLLTTSVTGVARRMMPDRSWGRFGVNLAVGRVAPGNGPGPLDARLPPSRPRTLIGSRQGRQAFQRAGLAEHPPDQRPCRHTWQPNGPSNKLFADAHLDWRDAERVRAPSSTS